jgi:hypothetical protein
VAKTYQASMRLGNGRANVHFISFWQFPFFPGAKITSDAKVYGIKDIESTSQPPTNCCEDKEKQLKKKKK